MWALCPNHSELWLLQIVGLNTVSRHYGHPDELHISCPYLISFLLNITRSNSWSCKGPGVYPSGRRSVTRRTAAAHTLAPGGINMIRMFLPGGSHRARFNDMK